MEQEKFEAQAYIKYKEEPLNKKPINKELISKLGKMIFELQLKDLYDEGMKLGIGNVNFLIKTTEFFMTEIVSFFIIGNEEETKIQISLFIDEVKKKTVKIVEDIFKSENQLGL